MTKDLCETCGIGIEESPGGCCCGKWDNNPYKITWEITLKQCKAALHAGDDNALE